jgi:hypothetical protein
MLTRNAKVIQSHPMKVGVDMTVCNPPLERVFDMLCWFAKIFFKFTSWESSVLRHRDVGKRREIIDSILVINLRDASS